MEDAGEKFTGDLVHVGDHEQEALRSREGGGQSTGDQRTVHSTGSTSFGLHFTDGDSLIHQVLLALGRPFVGQFAHDGRGRDGVDGGNVAQGVGNVRGGGIAVHSLHVFSHKVLLIGCPPCGGKMPA